MRISRLGPSLPWKRVVGELALIVGGVLIALALDSWWAGRQERQTEIAYLEQLLVDLRETESRLQRSIAGDTRTLEGVGSVLERAFHGPLPSPDSLDLGTGYSQFRPLTGTLVAVMQGGDLRLLQNDSLRFQLVAYSALIDATETLLRHTEVLLWNTTERVIHGRARHSRSPAGSGGDPTGWGSIDVAAALSDPDLVSALQVHAAASRNRIRNLQRLEEPTARLIRLLEDELSRR